MEKYVVTCFDEETGEWMNGDIPTSKSHARRWANENAKLYGGIWDIAPAQSK